ncbi:MAG: cadmium-translocating P-type ATPase, partial [Ruminococcus sp.]|nr:cadmium-translocating P-type ATPase [Ruminococcus sp.]
MACKHEHCCCHDHEHEHGHEHSHEHEHHHEENSKLELIFLIISIILAGTAFVFELLQFNQIAVGILAGIAIVLSGYEVCIEGVKSVINRRIDETTLMTVAVIAAFILGEFVEGAMVTILFGIGEMLEDIAVENSHKSIEKLANIQADTAHIITDGTEKTVDAQEVEINTEIIIKPHERIPLDCVITEGAGNVDASAITGESMPIECGKGSELLSGMINGDNLIKAKVTKTFSNSTASRIIKLVEEAGETKSNNEKLISRFAKFYTPIVMVIAILIAFIPPIFFCNITTWIYRGLVCLVASCPCAIVISVPLAYYSGIGRASKAGVLIKGGKYLEALSQVDTMVFDKTGTLTEGKLEIINIIPFENYSKEDILALAASVEKNSTHPIARAIVDAYKGEFLEMTDYSEKSGKGVKAIYQDKEISCGAGKSGGICLMYDGVKIGKIELSDKIRAEAKTVIKSIT